MDVTDQVQFPSANQNAQIADSMRPLDTEILSKSRFLSEIDAPSELSTSLSIQLQDVAPKTEKTLSTNVSSRQGTGIYVPTEELSSSSIRADSTVVPSSSTVSLSIAQDPPQGHITMRLSQDLASGILSSHAQGTDGDEQDTLKHSSLEGLFVDARGNQGEAFSHGLLGVSKLPGLSDVITKRNDTGLAPTFTDVENTDKKLLAPVSDGKCLDSINTTVKAPADSIRFPITNDGLSKHGQFLGSAQLEVGQPAHSGRTSISTIWAGGETRYERGSEATIDPTISVRARTTEFRAPPTSANLIQTAPIRDNLGPFEVTAEAEKTQDAMGRVSVGASEVALKGPIKLGSWGSAITVSPHTLNPAHQIVAHVSSTSKISDVREFEIRLDPEELGKVRINIGPKELGLVISIGVERPETLDLLRRNSGELLENLEDMGFDGATLEFNQGSEAKPATDQDDEEELPVLMAPPIQGTSTQTVTLVANDRLDIRL